MTSFDVARSLHSSRERRTRWFLAAAAAALCIGAITSVNPILGVALTVAACLGLTLMLRPALAVALLIFTVYFETLQFGGVTISRLIAPAILLFLIAALSSRGGGLAFVPAFAFVCAYVLWALASGLWSASFSGTMNSLASLVIALTYMGAAAMLISSKDDLKLAMYALAVAALVSGIIAMTEFVSGEARASAGKGDPNLLAALQVLALPVVIALAIETRKSWLRRCLYGAAAVIVASVFTSLSRGGLIALGIVLMLAMALPAGSFFRSRSQKLWTALAVIVALAIAFQSTSQSLEARLADPGGGSGRVYIWNAAWDSVQEHPVTGTGFGSFVEISNDLLRNTPEVDFAHYKLRPGGTEVHNTYLGTLAELGLIGLLLFLGLLISTAMFFLKMARRSAAVAPATGRFANAFLLSLVGWAIASFFLSTETARPLWLLIGLALALPKVVAHEASARELRSD